MHVGAIRPADALHHGGQGGKGAAGADPPVGDAQRGVVGQLLLQDIGGQLLHGGEVPMAGDGRLAEEANRAHLAGEGAHQVGALPHHQLGGAAADVDHAAVAPVGGTQEGELRLPVAGADLQFHLGFLQQALGKLGLVAGIPGGGGGKEMHRLGTLRPGFPCHAAHGGQGGIHGGLAQVAICVQAGEEAGAFPVTEQAAEGAVFHIDQQHSHRIGTNADGCSFHGLSS